MASALEFYASAFDAESLYGLRMVIAWISVAVFIWLLSLSLAGLAGQFKVH